MNYSKELLQKLVEEKVTDHFEEKASAISEREKEVNAFIELFLEEARKKSVELEEKKRKGKKLGKLFGLVVAVKNNIAVKGKKLTCASKMLENYVSPYSASVIEKIEAEDAIVIGSTNLDEFATGSDTTSSALKLTRNPLDLQRVPGGSSGGSAAAVAAGFCDVALGSDTGGSIRCPASFCGVVGFKPSHGLVSRYGLVDMAMSFDQIGPISKDVFGSALLLSVIGGEDYRDNLTKGSKQKEFEKLFEGKEKLSIGVPKQFFEGCNSQVKKIVENSLHKLEQIYSIKQISLPILEYSLPAYYLLVYSEFASAMQKYDGLKYGAGWREDADLIEAVSEVRDKNFGKEVKRRILLGTYITSKEYREAWYSKTLKVRQLIQKELLHALKEVDLLAGPTMPSIAWKIGEKSRDPLQMYLEDILTVPANLGGLPSGTVPCGFSREKMPVGLQFIGRPFEDERVLRAMHAFEGLVK